jgi:hypothetical protein
MPELVVLAYLCKKKLKMPELIVPAFLYVGLDTFKSNRSNRSGRVRVGYLTQPDLIKIFSSGQTNYPTQPNLCGALITILIGDWLKIKSHDHHIKKNFILTHQYF